MTHYFIIPGYQGSGENHWQSHFEKSNNNFIRIHQKDWDHPNINEWADTVEKVISKYDPAEVVLVGHSMGCPTIAAWANKYNRNIKGALLVAPADLESKNELMDFVGLKEYPNKRLNFKSIVVASTNDPWASFEKTKYFASNWGSELINIGAAGHINDQSGLGLWNEGMEILNMIG
jgi:uncharacterized protein